MRRFRPLVALALAAALLVSLAQVSAAATAAKAIDRYYPAAVFPDPQHYLNGGGIARAADGTYWITDQDRDRLIHVSDDGQVIAYVGGYGNGNGRFNSPTGIAISYAGTIYVADSMNFRVQAFAPTGEFLYKWGSYGTGNSQFHSMGGVAIDGNHDVWVVDSGNNRVQKFSAAGAFLAKCGGTASSSADGMFDQPQGIATDGTNAFVADAGNHRVQVLDSSCAYADKFGAFGPGDGQFQWPYGVATDENGSIYVADADSCRIKRWDDNGPSYSFIWKFGTPPGSPAASWDVGALASPKALVACGDGTEPFAIVDSTGLRLWDPDTVAPIDPPAAGDQYLFGGVGSNGLNGPRGVAAGHSGAVWVGNGYGNELVRMTQSGTTVTYRSAITTYLPAPDPEAQLSGIADVACDTAGNVYVLEAGNDRVVKFDVNGAFVRRWGGNGTTDGKFDYPQGIGILGNRVYVADTENDRVQIFDLDGNFVDKFGTPSVFDRPTDVAEANGSIYVVDPGDYDVKRFSRTSPFALQDAIGGYRDDDQPGSFRSPTYIEADGCGGVYVLEEHAQRVTKLAYNGEFLNWFGSLGTDENEFTLPAGIAVDSSGRVLVVDTNNNRLSVFAPDSETLTRCTVNVPAPAYDSTVTLTAWVTDVDGVPIGGGDLDIQRSYDGVAWSHVAYATSDVDGVAVPVGGITKKTWYRAVFTGRMLTWYGPSTVMTPVAVTPKVKSLTNPKAPSSALKDASFTVYGYLEPKHAAGGHSVRIYKYLKTGSTWRSKSYVTAKNYNSGSKTKYSLSMKLRTKGTWRLRACAPGDSLHATTWSSWYDTITIK